MVRYSGTLKRGHYGQDESFVQKEPEYEWFPGFLKRVSEASVLGRRSRSGTNELLCLRRSKGYGTGGDMMFEK